MTMTPVSGSTMIHAVGFSGDTLTVQFHNKAGEATDTWAYSPVPERVYREWEAADFSGKYFHANIRGQYAGKKVS